ncbi:hypothetical protein AB0P12_19585 [Streptomyces subrutilus]|uniref:Uncharacterized protein n=1 Tax=Streptomyces subrutilus TaxID=36818 RepID=A0A5P2UIY2_9ACTN|nr:hypothetical protein [Streptomyces subrutilus]QEU79236.1 hypothetical protein CP968_13750 [Streptomyces subrutilus]WSJ31572.1 hypothetical protein OG479_21075 [Streptomyces subrutilus]GGZ52924.1 hypothetical protein GCM10010371_10550 [Streptomyces subrutilus]
MPAPAGAPREPRPSAVPMRALLAAGLAATAVSTPPARRPAPDEEAPRAAVRRQAAPESEAA